MSELWTLFYPASVSTISESMAEAQDLEHIGVIENLTSDLQNLNTSTAGNNVNIDGVNYSSEILLIHDLIKSHKLVYSTG